MINKIDFNAKNLASNAGLFLLLENAKSKGIFELIENELVFDNDSTNKIKMNHIKTMLCGQFLLFKLDSLSLVEYRQQIKTFRLKYVFLVAKIIKTARNVIMKLSFNYPYKAVYEKCLT